MKVDAVHAYFKMSCIAKPVYRASFLCLYYCMVEFVGLHISLSKLRNLLLDFPYLNSFVNELKGSR